MELRYPFVIIIGIAILLIFIVLKFRKKERYKEGTKVANTKYLKDDPYYKKVVKRYKIILYTEMVLCLFSIFLSLILISRPVKEDTIDNTIYSRDIFLCMDVSTSVNELNEELVKSLKEVVKNMNGERFGISIFNTSSVLLVPLTDDYEYIINVLDTLEESLNSTNNHNFSNKDYLYLYNYIMSGTLVENEDRGSSIIGDGLASCVYNFSDIYEERSRIIIFSTDNDMTGTPIITLEEAAKLCKEKNINVFGIAPNKINQEDKEELENAVKLTGGELYINSKTDNVKNIINSIESKEKSLIKGKKEVLKIDIPQVPFILLVISLFIFCILNKRVNI